MLTMLNALRERFGSVITRRLVDPALKKAVRRKTPSQKPSLDDPVDFVAALKLPDGRNYDFTGHEDLKAIAADKARVVIVEKAAQKGVTELMLRLQFWLCKQGYSSAYFLRSLPYMKMQVQRRVEPLIAANRILQEALVADAEKELLGESEEGVPRKYRLRDNIRLKKLWNGWCFYMGLQSEADVRMFPLDAIFVDEVETLKPELTDALQERLYHSPLKWERWFSQPTVAGYGIDERFAETDQRYWHLKCPNCGEWFALEEHFPKVLMAMVDGQPVLWGGDWDATQWDSRWQFSYCCPFCKTPLDPLTIPQKEWVARYPSRDSHGYHLTQLYSGTMTATEIAQLWHRAQFSVRRKERFVNSVLGLPYMGGERQPITPEKVFYGTHEPTGMLVESHRRYAGVDVGDVNHLVVLEANESDGRLYVVWAEEVKGTNKWEILLRRIVDLKVAGVAINAMPYKDSAKKLLRNLPPEIKGALVYDTATKGISISEEDKELNAPVLTISANRTELMDGTVDALLSGQIVLPRRGLPQTEAIVRHLMNYIVEYDESGNRHYAKGRQDHFGRAMDYARLIAVNAAPLRFAPLDRVRVDWLDGEPIAMPLTGVHW